MFISEKIIAVFARSILNIWQNFILMLRRCKPEADNLASTIKGSGLKWKETFFNSFLVQTKLKYSSSKYCMSNSGAMHHWPSAKITFWICKNELPVPQPPVVC